jgi:FkbM family methyltransferase
MLRAALGQGCFVYGAGGYGRRILRLLSEQNFACAGIIDQKFVQMPDYFIAGTPVFHPDALTRELVEGKALVIGVHNHVTNLAPVFEFAAKNQFAEILFYADLPDALGPGASNYWLVERAHIHANFDAAVGAAGHFADDRSLSLYQDLIRLRYGNDLTLRLHPDTARQYYPEGLLKFSGAITFVDGGAYTGDSFLSLTRLGMEISQWIGFEPDFENLKAAGAVELHGTQAILFPCGLADRSVSRPFRTGLGAASGLVAGGGMVPCVALDDVMRGIKPDYIKLDIEGAERLALRGMARTIKTFQPHLAISVYHEPGHLWEIIEDLVELAPYADLYLRLHGENAFDTVVYAVPRD